LEKVLLGESPGCTLDNVLPSKAGALTVLEVLKIQMNFWPTLGSRFSDLQAQWGMYCLKNKSEDLSLPIPLNAFEYCGKKFRFSSSGKEEKLDRNAEPA
jgi:hypothetical protein